MKFHRIPNAGSAGVIKDLSEHELPAGVWTDCKNIRFYGGRVHQSRGHGQVFGNTSVIPYHILPVVFTNDDRHWMYLGEKKIYDVVYDASGESGTHTNITRQSSGADVDYSGTYNGWTSCVLGGIPVVNAGNVTDTPQYWSLNTAAKMDEITAWPANTYCESMRVYKNFLIALNITKGASKYPHMVKWSAPAVPGALPSTWDESDATNDAGELDLAVGYDPIVDGLQLRDSFMIYKESSVWRMDYVGGQSIFRVSKVLGTSGAMNRNCIVEVNGSHFVLTGSDVILHDGSSAVSILDNVTRRHLFDSIGSEQINKCFVFGVPFSPEVFVCYPSGGSVYCDKAMVWNYQDKTVSFRDLPNVNHATVGTLGTASDAWGADTDPWDSDTTSWSAAGQDTADRTKAVLASNDSKLFKLDSTYLFDGAIPEASLERKGLVLSPDENRVIVTSIRPRITGNNGQTLTISVGYHDTDPYAEPIYPSSGVMTHTIGETAKDCCLVTGRYIAIKLETAGAYQWTLDSLDIEYREVGRW